MNQNSRPRDVTRPRPNPNAKWLCGYEASGLACSEGPSEQGVCCQLRREPSAAGQPEGCPQMTCERECSAADGCELAGLRRQPQLPSHHELGPCVPRKAAWFSRQVLALNVAILVAGLLLLCMAFPQREAVYVPGGLSHKHTQILGNRLVAERCSLCHPNAHTQAVGAVLQDELCMKCHDSHLPEAFRRSPHDLSAQQLSRIEDQQRSRETEEASPASGASPGSLRGMLTGFSPGSLQGMLAEPGPLRPSQPTSCAMCHLEHRGQAFDLKAISDASCQACHQQRFTSLSAGHPAFEQYPYRTQRRLAFDHAAHEQKHFGVKNEVFECSRCHVDRQQAGDVGPVFRSVGFEQACASCHAAPLEAAMVNGWAAVQTPSIDARDVDDPTLGDWPQGARFGREGVITGPMRVLLAADSQAAEALARLPPSGRLEDLSNASDERAEVTRALASAFRRLVAEVAAEGQAAWKRRLTTTARERLRRDLQPAELRLIEQLSAGLPPDLFRHMERQWFGEQAAMASQNLSPQSPVPQKTSRSPTLPEGEQRLLDDTSLAEENLLSSDNLLSADSLLSTDDLLGAASADDLLLPAGGEPSPQNLSPRNLSPRNLSPEQPLPSPSLERLRGAVHVQSGGWYVDDALLALRYMPRGHADRTLAAWTEFSYLLELATGERSISGDDTVSAACTQCHLLGSPQLASTEWDSWRSVSHPQTIRPFTKFDHTPHLTLPTLNDCRYCHRVNGKQDSSLGEEWQRASGSSHAATTGELRQLAHEFLSREFTAMHVAQCAACHRPGGASDGCTQCHNYHVDAAGFARTQSPAMQPSRTQPIKQP